MFKYIFSVVSVLSVLGRYVCVRKREIGRTKNKRTRYSRKGRGNKKGVKHTGASGGGCNRLSLVSWTQVRSLVCVYLCMCICAYVFVCLCFRVFMYVLVLNVGRVTLFISLCFCVYISKSHFLSPMRVLRVRYVYMGQRCFLSPF